MIKLSNGMIFNEAEIRAILPKFEMTEKNDLELTVLNHVDGWRVVWIDGSWHEITQEEKAELEKGMGNETP